MTHCLFVGREDYANHTASAGHKSHNSFAVLGMEELNHNRNTMLRSQCNICFESSNWHWFSHDFVIIFTLRGRRCLPRFRRRRSRTHFNNSECFHFICRSQCIILEFTILNYSKCNDESTTMPYRRVVLAQNGEHTKKLVLVPSFDLQSLRNDRIRLYFLSFLKPDFMAKATLMYRMSVSVAALQESIQHRYGGSEYSFTFCTSQPFSFSCVYVFKSKKTIKSRFCTSLCLFAWFSQQRQKRRQTVLATPFSQ